MGSFSSKVAFLTGAGSGIARASAKMLAAEGAQVVIAEIAPESGRETEKIIRDAGGDALFVETDVTREDSVRDAIRATVERYGRLDILHNCAGGSIIEDAAVTKVDMKVWDYTLTLDLRGTFLCCRHGIPEIIKSGGGSVINMTSWRGLMGGPSNHVYVAAKGGIISLTKTMAAEYANQGVRVNAIAPGAIRTERTAGKWGPSASGDALAYVQYRNRLAERYPFSIGVPEDVAHIVVFLASAKSRMITGAVIPADGGRSAYL